MNDRLRWIIPFPIFIFVAAAWIFVQTENEAWVQIDRAQRQWREGNYLKALTLYDGVHRNYPNSQYADDALWEIGTIYYVNLYNLESALGSFHKLTTQYPDSPLVPESYSKLAQIHEAELVDLPQAINYWNQMSSLDLSPERRRQVRFHIGNAHFKLNQFEEALIELEAILSDDHLDAITDQARIRAGAIMQIQGRHNESVKYFAEVLKETNCSECRRTARLGLIESYEFLGELPMAMKVAQAIPASEFPAQVKEDLLKRLGKKSEYYSP